MCPASGTTTRREPGIATAISRAHGSGDEVGLAGDDERRGGHVRQPAAKVEDGEDVPVEQQQCVAVDRLAGPQPLEVGPLPLAHPGEVEGQLAEDQLG